MTFLEILEESTVLVCFEKLESRFKDIAKSTTTLQCIIVSCKKRKEFFSLFRDIQNVLK